MDDTSRGVGDEKSRGIGKDAMQGRGEESTRNYAQPTPGTPGRSIQPGAASPTPRSTVPGSADESRSETGDEDADRRTREIRAEIEQTREDMSETIDAIQEKLRPGNIMSDAKERVKNATTERVRNMVGSASETAQDAMEQTRHYAGDVVEGARNNAIPVAMIGVGLAWLLVRGLEDRPYQRRALVGVPVLAVAFFAVMYPILVGWQMSNSYLDFTRVFSWVIP